MTLDPEKVWLEYHGNSSYAKAKLMSGLHLTPEAVAYMEHENETRRVAAKLKEEATKNDPEKAIVGTPVRSSGGAIGGVGDAQHDGAASKTEQAPAAGSADSGARTTGST